MSHPKVVNVRHGIPFDVYIGRMKDSALHWGNPFTHLSTAMPGTIKVPTREVAIQCHRDWLDGVAHQEVEPTRREWILANLPILKGKILGCYCAPKECHGDYYARKAESLVVLPEIPVDVDVRAMGRNELVAELMKLRKAIRTHRDSSGHDLCWFHPELWSLLPEKVLPQPSVPPLPEFLEHCRKYRESLNEPASQGGMGVRA